MCADAVILSTCAETAKNEEKSLCYRKPLCANNTTSKLKVEVCPYTSASQGTCSQDISKY